MRFLFNRIILKLIARINIIFSGPTKPLEGKSYLLKDKAIIYCVGKFNYWYVTKIEKNFLRLSPLLERDIGICCLLETYPYLFWLVDISDLELRKSFFNKPKSTTIKKRLRLDRFASRSFSKDFSLISIDTLTKGNLTLPEYIKVISGDNSNGILVKLDIYKLYKNINWEAIYQRLLSS